mmetsp:Transcript_41831/g.75951  ORF Transcript_41831/g.75951 Transcript_41831/m.75951 type:complete len:523 (+) Transcript_41831:134-1702(+)
MALRIPSVLLTLWCLDLLALSGCHAVVPQLAEDDSSCQAAQKAGSGEMNVVNLLQRNSSQVQPLSALDTHDSTEKAVKKHHHPAHHGHGHEPEEAEAEAEAEGEAEPMERMEPMEPMERMEPMEERMEASSEGREEMSESPPPMEEGGSLWSKEGSEEEGGEGSKPCCKGDQCDGLRLELYLRPPLRYIHQSAQGPIGSFMAELKARILFALDLPPEQVQMLGIRGQNLGKKVKFNMVQVSDSTFINETFARRDRELALEQAQVTSMRENATLKAQQNSSLKTAGAHEPDPEEKPKTSVGEYNTPVVIEGVIRPANMESAEESGEEGEESEAKEEPLADSSVSSGWRTHDDWRMKTGTVDPSIWNYQSMSVNGAMNAPGGWRVWDPLSGSWVAGKEGEGEGGERGEWKGSYGESWGVGAGNGDGMSYRTVVDFEVMPAKDGKMPSWAIQALKDETMDPNGRLMRGSLSPILAFARLISNEGENEGTVEALLQISSERSAAPVDASRTTLWLLPILCIASMMW